MGALHLYMGLHYGLVIFRGYIRYPLYGRGFAGCQTFSDILQTRRVRWYEVYVSLASSTIAIGSLMFGCSGPLGKVHPRPNLKPGKSMSNEQRCPRCPRCCRHESVGCVAHFQILSRIFAEPGMQLCYCSACVP